MTPEGAVKSQITQALKQMGFRVYRIQCGKWRVRGGWMHGAPNGTADTFVPVSLRGMAKAILWLEFKAKDGKLNSDQIGFAQSLPSGEYHLTAQSVDDVLDWLKKHEAKA